MQEFKFLTHYFTCGIIGLLLANGLLLLSFFFLDYDFYYDSELIWKQFIWMSIGGIIGGVVWNLIQVWMGRANFEVLISRGIGFFGYCMVLMTFYLICL